MRLKTENDFWSPHIYNMHTHKCACLLHMHAYPQLEIILSVRILSLRGFFW